MNQQGYMRRVGTTVFSPLDIMKSTEYRMSRDDGPILFCIGQSPPGIGRSRSEPHIHREYSWGRAIRMLVTKEKGGLNWGRAKVGTEAVPER